MSKSERESPWFKYGSDKQFQAFVRTLPCAICGQWAEYTTKGFRSQFCHHRGAGNAGTGFKPPYSGYPGCGKCHHDAHQYGEAGCLKRNKRGEWTRESAREFFQEAADQTLDKWVGTFLQII